MDYFQGWKLINLSTIVMQTSPVKWYNDKKKWQIALRRYIINKNKSVVYAPFFGLGVDAFRGWIETQFDENLNWDNFSATWHFEHVLPVACFNLEEDSELKLCWSFLNIKVEKINNGQKANKTDLYGIKKYFIHLYKETGIKLCEDMIYKIDKLQQEYLPNSRQLQFLKDNLNEITVLSGFTTVEFERLNSGESIANLLAEKELLKRFG
jgi:hypothetical protein